MDPASTKLGQSPPTTWGESQVPEGPGSRVSRCLEEPEEHPAPTLPRRQSWLSSSPLPSKQGRDRGHRAELLPTLRCRDQSELKMAPGCGAGLQRNDPGEVSQESK